MKELLYMYIETTNNRAHLSNQQIQFTNKYFVNVEKDEFNYISEIDIRRKDNLYEGFWGEKILNISALVGVNGIGKTTILDILGSTRTLRKRYVYDWEFFLLYKVDDLYVIEGNGLDVVSEVIEGLQNIPSPPSQEFSFICEYDEKKKKLIFMHFCREGDIVEESIKIFYFRDKPIDKQKFLKYEDDDGTDWNVCFERKDMKSDAANLYNTCFYFKKDKSMNECINLQNLTFAIGADTDIQVRNLQSFTIKMRKQIYILKILFAIVSRCENGELVINQLIGTDRKTHFFEFNPEKYEEYRASMISAINNSSRKSEVDVLNLEEIVYAISDKYFCATQSRPLLIYGDPVFSVKDGYEFNVYRLLLQYQEYLRFTYKGISAGEKKILDVFSGIFTNISFREADVDKTYIVLLDEPDKGLHPEMSRRLITWLVKAFSNEMFKNHYQFIISTHSPFLISDIPIPNIHCLKKENAADSWNTHIIGSKYGLLNSIPDILKDTFFMDSPFGEYGNLFFKSLVKEIEVLNSISNRKYVEQLEKKIQMVNDKVLRRYLDRTLEEKIIEFGGKNDQIYYYEQKLKELRGENNDKDT